MTYSELNPEKKAYIFELDNVLFPVRDYDLQVYYLFANFLEFQETYPPADDLISFMKKAYDNQGSDRIFERAKEVFGFEEKFRENFQRLQREAVLPLKLLLFQNMLALLQEIVVDRKQLFIVTSGDPLQQLNKIRQTEWHGLEKFLKVYFADEIAPKPAAGILDLFTEENDLKAAEMMIVGASDRDLQFALSAGIDYYPVNHFI